MTCFTFSILHTLTSLPYHSIFGTQLYGVPNHLPGDHMSKKKVTPLSQRKHEVLTKTIESFIETAEPVGSKWLRDQGGVDASPATIRNELSELESDGYLSHRHQSSGRVPTDKGYRLYVDQLMGQSADTPSTLSTGGLPISFTPITSLSDIPSHMPQIRQSVAGLLKEVTQLVVTLFDYTAIVIPPTIHHATLEVAHLVLLDIDRILVVVMNSIGSNNEFIVPTDQQVSQEDLNAMSQLLTRKLKGVSMSDIDPQQLSELWQQFPTHHAIVRTLVLELQRLKNSLPAPDSLNMKGVSNMVRLPEFKDPDLAHKVLATLEETRLMMGVLEQVATQAQPAVIIGSENQPEGLKDCSMVVAPLGNPQTNLGTLAIVGPTRMRYKKLLPTVQGIVTHIHRLLSVHASPTPLSSHKESIHD